jgi:hypothetical protein
MSYRTTVLAQVLGGLDAKEFARCAARHPMRRTPSAISAYDHFATMVFAQLTYRESLRDIEACLEARRQLLYHSGIRGKVKRCNLAYANTQRDWHVFAEVAAVLMRRAHRLYVDQPPEPDLPFGLFALDATLIELSLALFPWARWQSTHAAVKLNVLLDLRTDIPVFASIHEGSRHEVASLDEIPVQPDSFYVIDRGYMDFQRLHRLHAAKAFFVIRSKCNLRFYVVESRKVDKTTGVRCDQTIRLNFRKSREHYPETLRRIRYFDAESGLSLVFLTNAFHLPALTIAEIYRRRWQIELFFRVRHEVALATVHYETTINTEPAVPSAVVYRHRRGWQRPGRKLPRKCTFACHGREDDREEVFRTASVNAVQGLDWGTRLTQVNWAQASLTDKEPKALIGSGQKAMSPVDPLRNRVTRTIQATGVMPETTSPIVV